MLGVGIIAPLLPLYADSLGATGIWLGIIFASFSVTRAIFMPIFGRLSDRKGRKIFICIGLIIYSIISLGYIWADNVSQLTLVRLIQGTAAAMIIPIVIAYVGDTLPEGEEGKWMGYLQAALFSGFGIGPLLGGLLTDHFGMNVAFYSMGGLNLLAFLLAVLFLPEIRQRKMTTTPHLSFREIGASNIVKGIFSFRLGYSTGRGIFTCFLPIFAAVYIGLSPTSIGILLAVNMLLMSVLSVPLGRIADRFNRRVLVILGNSMYVIFLGLFPLVHNFWQLLLLCVLLGIGGAISLPAASALTVDEGRKLGMGTTIAIFTLAFSIGMAVGPLLGGVIADSVDINSVFYFGTAVGLIGTGLFAWFTRRH